MKVISKVQLKDNSETWWHGAGFTTEKQDAKKMDSSTASAAFPRINQAYADKSHLLLIKPA